MKKIIALIILCSLIGCNDIPNGKQINHPSNSNKPLHNFRLVDIDGCEYIEVDAGIAESAVYSLTHKGNCKNPIHHYLNTSF